MIRKLSLSTILAAAVAVQAHAQTAPSLYPSAFGCTGLETNRELPSVEGRDGVFFRINADLRMNHPFSDEVVGQLAKLSEALAARDTTLIFVPVPTKSVTMPDYLPDVARLYGFQLDVATTIHLDILERLEAAGVATVDAREAMLTAKPAEPAFFRSDFHWTAWGADLTAAAIGKRIKGLPVYDNLDQTPHETAPLQFETAFSGMRRILQKHCLETLPTPDTMTFETAVAAQTGELSLDDLGLASSDVGANGGLDIFGTQTDRPAVVLAGTSFSDSPINNFPGFIAQHAELEVVNYAITGGNQFGAMISYLTSTDFQEARPHILIWENPIYNNLAQYGDQPLRELVAAAENNCSAPLPASLSEDRLSLQVDLSQHGTDPTQTLFFDSAGSTGLTVDFRFRDSNGMERIKTIQRGDRLRRTGRFYMPLSGLWQASATSVTIEMDQPLGTAAGLSLCTPLSHTPTGDES